VVGALRGFPVTGAISQLTGLRTQAAAKKPLIFGKMSWRIGILHAKRMKRFLCGLLRYSTRFKHSLCKLIAVWFR
jgi:hypothetical protein